MVKLKTLYAKEEEIGIKAKVNIKKYLKNDFDKSKVRYVYDGDDTISYFTKPDTKIGKVTIKYKDKTLDEFDLIYKEALTFSLLSYIWINKWILVVLIIVSLLMIRIIHVQIRRYRRRKRRKRLNN